jgi:streptogramin lyase
MFKYAKPLATLAVTAAAFVGAAGTASAASFGADLDPSVQPSNAGQPHKCPDFEGEKCTWVLNDAYGAPGHEKAPETGTLKQIKLIAGAPGSFKLQLVKVKNDGSAKVVTNGPRIDYEGQDNPNANTYDVEKFDVHVPVHEGEQLAIATKKTSTLRCSSGGDNTLIYNPVLEVGNAAQDLGSDDGCWMLIEGKIS